LVGGHVQPPVRPGPGQGPHLVGGPGVNVGEDHLVAQGEVFPGHRQPEPGGRAGDEAAPRARLAGLPRRPVGLVPDTARSVAPGQESGHRVRPTLSSSFSLRSVSWSSYPLPAPAPTPAAAGGPSTPAAAPGSSRRAADSSTSGPNAIPRRWSP